MTALPTETTDDDTPTVSVLFEQRDVAQVSALYLGVADALGGAIRVAPAHPRGGADWAAVRQLNFTTPEHDGAPDTFDELARWFVLAEDVAGCTAETSFAVYFDPGRTGRDAPAISQLTGPKIDATIGRGVIYRELGLEDAFVWGFGATAALPAEPANDDNDGPVDLWQHRAHPPLPAGILPKQIEEFARSQGELMGVDPGGLAAAALAVCAAAIPDTIKLRVKRHDANWLESARIWVALVGDPSTKKSPLISAAAAPIKRLDRDLFFDHQDATRQYDALPQEERRTTSPPKHVRMRLEDTTIEAAQEVLKDSPDGVLCLQDELSGWFGAMDKYTSGRGAAKDRGFWLQSFNGGPYTINRVGRGAVLIENLSVSLLGGIQPGPIRQLAADAHDDGLLQRLFPIVLDSAGAGKDIPLPDATSAYDALVARLARLRRPTHDGIGNLSGLMPMPLRFDDDAQEVRSAFAEKTFALQAAWETVNRKLAAHIGKHDGLFARLCVVFHCIEDTASQTLPIIRADTAKRVADFIERFLLPHAVAFYVDVLGMADRHDHVLATAGYILAHRLDTISVRDVRRGDSTMRKLNNDEARAVLEQLDAFGWLDPLPAPRQDSARWRVLPAVHTMFAEQAKAEAARREEVRAIIRELVASG